MEFLAVSFMKSGCKPSAIAEHLLLLANIAPQFCSVKLDGEKIEHVQNGAIIIVSPEASVNYVKNEVENELKKMDTAA